MYCNLAVKNCSPAPKTQHILYAANHQCWFSKEEKYIFNGLAFQ